MIKTPLTLLQKIKDKFQSHKKQIPFYITNAFAIAIIIMMIVEQQSGSDRWGNWFIIMLFVVWLRWQLTADRKDAETSRYVEIIKNQLIELAELAQEANKTTQEAEKTTRNALKLNELLSKDREQNIQFTKNTPNIKDYYIPTPVTCVHDGCSTCHGLRLKRAGGVCTESIHDVVCPCAKCSPTT